MDQGRMTAGNNLGPEIREPKGWYVRKIGGKTVVGSWVQEPSQSIVVSPANGSETI